MTTLTSPESGLQHYGRLDALRAEFAKVECVLAETPGVDRFFSIPTDEFLSRQRRTYEAWLVPL